MFKHLGVYGPDLLLLLLNAVAPGAEKMTMKTAKKLKSCIRKGLHKAKQVAGDLHRRIVGPRTEDSPLNNLFDTNLRWPRPEATSPPLWMRHGRTEMLPIIIVSDWNRRGSSNMRLMPHYDLWPYVHCEGCQCGEESGYVRCLCIECAFFHGVTWWSPCADGLPVLFQERKKQRLRWLSKLTWF